MGLVQETNHRAAILDLAAPFWGKPRIVSVLVAALDQIQRLEDDAWDIMVSRTLDEADIVRLKVLGKLVGQPRHGFDTEDYRTLIRARARANRSQGTARDLAEVLLILVGSANFSMVEAGDATLLVTALIPLDANALAMLAEILPDTRAAGVGLQLFFSDDVSTDVFHWGDPWPGSLGWASVRTL